MGLLDSLFSTGQSEANRKNQANFDWIKALGTKGVDGLPGLLPLLLESYSQGMPYMQQAVDVAKTGQADANRLTAARGAESYRAIQDMVAQGASAATQGAVSSGLGSGSAAGQARAQAAYQGARAAGQLGEGLAGISANTALQGAAQTGSALQGLASYWASRGKAYAGAGQGLQNTLSQFQWQGGQAPIDSLLGLGGAALGGWAMGGFK
ncbi:MAG: hypothetical protein JSV86_07630 [Gemmatimonadota bacterium]|nr:MAG: hypothetical protein JSV86_07630 [Gemmatimonadota bacterium]